MARHASDAGNQTLDRDRLRGGQRGGVAGETITGLGLRHGTAYGGIQRVWRAAHASGRDVEGVDRAKVVESTLVKGGVPQPHVARSGAYHADGPDEGRSERC